jgi:formylglycine-generating enzyme required for sulfatase activity
MIERKSLGRHLCWSVVSFAIGVCGFLISTAAVGVAQEGSTPTYTYSTNDLGMDFVSVQPGQFPMGCTEGVTPVECDSEEKPRHTVQITKGLEMGKTEVTEKQWVALMGSNPSLYKGDDLPVEQVTFNDVQAFLTKMNARNDGYLYRLPTEAEWEYAARAGAPDQFGGAKVANSLRRNSPPDNEAWYNVERPQPVATKQPNAWGLYDMRGNVDEWCQDWYDPKYYSKSPMADPKGPDTDAAEGGRIVRGGGFHDDGPWLTRVSLRQHFPEDYQYRDLGFRVVREKR